jgi:hypothetical protein
MHVPLARQQQQLLLGEVRVDERQRYAVKRQIPRGEPRVLPLVRHTDHVSVVEMFPADVAAVLAIAGWRHLAFVAVQPLAHVVVEKLLAPDQARQRLPLYAARLGIGEVGLQRGVELVGVLADSLLTFDSLSVNKRSPLSQYRR